MSATLKSPDFCGGYEVETLMEIDTESVFPLWTACAAVNDPMLNNFTSAEFAGAVEQVVVE
jgi:hypothetical protein